MRHYVTVGIVVFVILGFLGLFVVPIGVCGCGRGDPFSRQEWQMREVLDALRHYAEDHGEPARTDEQSPWYIKLTEAQDPNAARCCPDGYLYDAPLDHYGNLLIVEYPKDNWNFIVRSAGANGIDDGGALDDWTYGSEPKLGYWYKSDWIKNSVLAIMAAIASGVMIRIWTRVVRRFAGRFVLSLLTIGLLNGVLTNDGGAHAAPIAAITGTVGVIALVVGAYTAICWFIGASTRPKDSAVNISQPPVCGNCGYDLRGSPSGVCSECGQDSNSTARIAETAAWNINDFAIGECEAPRGTEPRR